MSRKWAIANSTETSRCGKSRGPVFACIPSRTILLSHRNTLVWSARFISQPSQCDCLHSFLDDSFERYKPTPCVNHNTTDKPHFRPGTRVTSSILTPSTTGLWFTHSCSTVHETRFVTLLVKTCSIHGQSGTFGTRKSSNTSWQT